MICEPDLDAVIDLYYTARVIQHMLSKQGLAKYSVSQERFIDLIIKCEIH
jgi:hypothetical protein